MSTRKVTYYMFGSVSSSVSGYIYLPVGVIDLQLLLQTVLNHELFSVMSIQIGDGLRLVDIHLIDLVIAYHFGLAMHSERPFMQTQLVNHWTKSTSYILHEKINTKARSQQEE